MAKKSVICDTDVMIDFLNKKQLRHLETSEILNKIGLDFICISAITKMELIAGVGNKAELTSLKKNIGYFQSILINSDITLIAQKLMETYRLSHGLGIADSFVAATSIFTGIELFTYNLKDFKFIAELKLFDQTF